jgi:hypothetical protein
VRTFAVPAAPAGAGPAAPRCAPKRSANPPVSGAWPYRVLCMSLALGLVLEGLPSKPAVNARGVADNGADAEAEASWCPRR